MKSCFTVVAHGGMLREKKMIKSKMRKTFYNKIFCIVTANAYCYVGNLQLVEAKGNHKLWQKFDEPLSTFAEK